MNFLTSLTRRLFNTPLQIGNNKLATIYDVNQVIAVMNSQNRNYFRAVTDYFEVDNTNKSVVVTTNSAASCADCTDIEKSKYTCNCGGTIVNSGKKASAASIAVTNPETGIFDVIVTPDPTSNYTVNKTILVVGNPSASDDLITVLRLSNTHFRVKVKDTKTGNLVNETLKNVPFNLTTFYNV